ncbi:MAG: hypothetical protein H0X17_03800 [Deltaproteobacteria bacterium]|nr:hypothetical protein [Deltaproteobacteria bacterium]
MPARDLRRPTPRSHRRWLIIAAVVGVFAATVVIAGLTIINRVETGTWQVPDTDDFVRVVKRQERGPSKTIFLERAPIGLRPGIDDAPAGISSVLASARNQPTRLAGWKGSRATWKKVVTCVSALFSPFDVVVTDQRPTHEDFVLVVVGGRASDIGAKDRRIGGLAPFSGAVIPKPVVFAFSTALNHDVRAICETIGMEVAHAYGLDHGYDCKDVMTYLGPCGAKRFVDKAVRCGEKKARDCEGGAPTQNSYQQLVRVLGAKR